MKSCKEQSEGKSIAEHIDLHIFLSQGRLRWWQLLSMSAVPGTAGDETGGREAPAEITTHEEGRDAEMQNPTLGQGAAVPRAVGVCVPIPIPVPFLRFYV